MRLEIDWPPKSSLKTSLAQLGDPAKRRPHSSRDAEAEKWVELIRAAGPSP